MTGTWRRKLFPNYLIQRWQFYWYCIKGFSISLPSGLPEAPAPVWCLLHDTSNYNCLENIKVKSFHNTNILVPDIEKYQKFDWIEWRSKSNTKKVISIPTKKILRLKNFWSIFNTSCGYVKSLLPTFLFL